MGPPPKKKEMGTNMMEQLFLDKVARYSLDKVIFQQMVLDY